MVCDGDGHIVVCGGDGVGAYCGLWWGWGRAYCGFLWGNLKE